MGDRGQIAIKQSSKKDERVYLYTHWSGSDIPNILKTALEKRERWDDEEYLARIVFNAMVGKHDGTTGFGISTSMHGDIEHPVPVLDCSSRSITWEPGSFSDTTYPDQSFAEFLEKPVSFYDDDD